jgi:drug/metabolite transporter (DMT)-like permease
MEFVTQYAGEIAALSAAFLWAFASVIFKQLGNSIKPLELNLVKGIGGVLLLASTSLLLRETFSSLSFLVIFLLIISGIIGIGFGDTMYFEALNLIGPRRTLLISISAPLMTAILAFLFLGEKIAVFGWIGVLITAAGIAWVVTAKEPDGTKTFGMNRKGILYGFLFALAQSIGSVISRWALTQTEITALQSAVIRMFAGVIFLFIWAFFRHVRLGEWIKSKTDSKIWGRIALGIILGAYIPLWLQQVAFQNTEVGIAQTFLATSPLFILPIMALKKEKISLREILGVVVAVAGIAILFLIQ